MRSSRSRWAARAGDPAETRQRGYEPQEVKANELKERNR
jgi:hypothetical protein